MHPVLARGRRVASYAAAWILVGVLFGTVLAAGTSLRTLGAMAIAVPLAVTYGFVCLSAWYLSRSMPIETSGAPRIVATSTVASVLTAAALVLGSRAWVGWVVARMGSAPSSRPSGLDAAVFLAGLLLYLLAIALGYVLAAFEHSRSAERRALEGQVLAREAELRSLRAQVDPHFLFNSLNSIGALTVADPPAARRMCQLLAEYLRETLKVGEETRIALEREVSLSERYLEIERTRFGDRLRVEVDLDSAAECLVPPLLLQPVVENAVTHGIAHLLEGGTVRIRASRSPATLTITVENPCDRERPRRTGTGVGLGNVRSRLHGVFGHDATFQASERNGAWRVVMTMPASSPGGNQA